MPVRRDPYWRKQYYCGSQGKNGGNSNRGISNTTTADGTTTAVAATIITATTTATTASTTSATYATAPKRKRKKMMAAVDSISLSVVSTIDEDTGKTELVAMTFLDSNRRDFIS